jgi:hypothetical protein
LNRYQQVLSELDTIETAAIESQWWEVKVQAVVVCCSLLKYINITDDEWHNRLCDICGRVIDSSQSLISRILGMHGLFSVGVR